MYHTDFYDAYEKYLSEPSVRKAHDWVFRLVSCDACFQSVVDFGCGRSCEFQKFFRPYLYLGIDVNAESPNLKADYRKCDLSVALGRTAFVSLFSSEITATAKENYQFYERVFNEVPTIQKALVSGFFYAGKDVEVVEESCGVTSYQSIEKIDSVVSSIFTEKRITLPVPSLMFGSSVFEVWKLLEKRHGL